MWADANSACAAARSTAAAAVSISRISASVSAIGASSRSTQPTSRSAASILVNRLGKPLGLVAIGQLLDSATGRLDAGLTRLHGGARLFGGRLGGLLHLGGGEFVFVGLRGGLLQLGDRGGALRDVGLQPTPLGQRRDGRFERGIGGCGDHLGLLELLGQRGDLLGRGSRRRPVA